jgi:hypothetical protein
MCNNEGHRPGLGEWQGLRPEHCRYIRNKIVLLFASPFSLIKPKFLVVQGSGTLRIKPPAQKVKGKRYKG